MRLYKILTAEYYLVKFNKPSQEIENMTRIGIVGVTGLVGETLFSLLWNHPEAVITYLASDHAAGKKLGEALPRFRDIDLPLHPTDLELIKENCDVVFICKPHGASMDLVKEIIPLGIKVIDSGADFRLKNAELFSQWYGKPHTAPQLLTNSVYGLPELHKEEIAKTNLVAVPGCYPTGVILAVAPLAKAGLIEGEVIANCYSGISGAGRNYNPSVGNLFIDCYDDLRPYNVLKHRHTPEMEQELSFLAGREISVLFVPHLAPIERGILSTVYVKLKDKLSEDSLYELYNEFYKEAPFVRISSSLPSTKLVRNTNYCDISLRLDGDWVVCISAIDNLMKGAAGQAVECFNIMNDYSWEEGLKWEKLKWGCIT
jgi:N-acetyl-gamma-glutamyl-phosphate reductase